MDKLYPIIRRKRRPLMVADVPPVAAGPVQPVAAMPQVETVPVLADGQSFRTGTLVEPEQPKSSRAKSKRNAK
jgi:hypothetical protein